MKKLRYLLLSLLLVFSTILPVSAQEGITVSLRIENTDTTILEKTTLSGVTDQDNDGTITPMEVLNCAVDNNYLTSWEANSYGYAGSINGIEGTWMYALDNSTWNNTVSDGTNIVYYLYDTDLYYDYFESEEYTVLVDTDIDITLYQFNTWYGSVSAGSGISIVDYGDSSIVYGETDSNGIITLSFDSAGEYEITTDDYNSRAYAKITVVYSTSEAINSAIEETSISESIDSSITLPTTINGVSISWSSSNEKVLSSSGVVGSVSEDTQVVLTATYTDSDDNKVTITYTVTVYANTTEEAYDAGTLSDSTSVWYQDGTNQSLTDTLTPTSEDTTDLLWINSTLSAASDPIIVEDYVYVISSTYDENWNASSSLVRLDRETGEILASVELSSGQGWNADLAYGDGMIFVSTSTGVQAFNENNLVSLWFYETDSQVSSDLTYADGYLYAGTYNGTFFALQVSDDDTTTGKETKTPVWTYTSSDSYYYNQATIIGDYIYFAGYDGILVKHSLTGDSYETLSLSDTTFSGGITYEDGYLYIIDTATTLYKVSLDTFKLVTSTTIYEGGRSTSTPTIYNGRIYVGGSIDEDNTYYTDGFISVIDADTLEVIDTALTDGYMQAQPLVTTAYDGVVVYFTCNTGSGDGVYYFTDYEGNTSIDVGVLYNLSGSTYNMNNIVVDENGVLYFTSGIGQVVALYNTNPDASTSLIPSSKTTSTSNGESSTSDQVATYDHTLLYGYMTVGLLSAGLFVSLYNKKEYLQ